MTVVPLSATQGVIGGLWVINTKSISDERGTVREFFRTSGFADLGIEALPKWNQVNVTWTRHGALRGLHGEQMIKLVGVAHGSAHGVYLDTRPGSASYGMHTTVDLIPGIQVLIPAGVCNGFQATSEDGCEYVYCMESEWVPGMAGVAVNPLDPSLGIAWPVPIDASDPAQISAKDAAAPLFSELS